jgi:hypothetical protein
MLAEEARVGRVVDLFRVGYELHQQYGLTDSELFAAKTLEDLAASVAERLGPVADRHARAGEIVVETARRVAPALLSEVGTDL